MTLRGLTVVVIIIAVTGAAVVACASPVPAPTSSGIDQEPWAFSKILGQFTAAR